MPTASITLRAARGSASLTLGDPRVDDCAVLFERTGRYPTRTPALLLAHYPQDGIRAFANNLADIMPLGAVEPADRDGLQFSFPGGSTMHVYAASVLFANPLGFAEREFRSEDWSARPAQVLFDLMEEIDRRLQTQTTGVP